MERQAGRLMSGHEGMAAASKGGRSVAAGWAGSRPAMMFAGGRVGGDEIKRPRSLY